MTQSRFKSFKAGLLRAKGTPKEKDYINDICMMGYVWLELTNKQSVIMREWLLENFPTYCTNTKDGVIFNNIFIFRKEVKR